MAEIQTIAPDYTEVKQIRAFLCVSCLHANIFERRTMKRPNLPRKNPNLPYEEVLDQNVFLGNFMVTGGKLLKNRPNIPWEQEDEFFWDTKGEVPPDLLFFTVSLQHGGLCSECLEHHHAEERFKGQIEEL